MKILGISAFYHDSAASVTVDGKIVAAAQEEWFTRLKHDPGFPIHAIRFCLEHSGLRLEELDAIAFYDKPYLKFERLLETYYNFSPNGLGSFIKAIPVWVKEKLFLKDVIRRELKTLDPDIRRMPVLLFPEHHLSHAAGAFYPSPFEESAILTLDGVGEWATASICMGRGREITILKELRFPHSIGLLYSAFTYFLGFKVNFGEYKLMGLAPYGDPDSGEVSRFEQLIETELVDIRADGSIWLNQAYFNYAVGQRMIREQKWQKLFGFATRSPDTEMEQKHCNLALAIQRVTEKIVLAMAAEARRLTGSANLCLAGGVALNCVANGKLLESGLFDRLFIQPAAGDAGGALGAALAAEHIYFEKNRVLPEGLDGMNGAYLGPEFSNLEIERIARKYKMPFRELDDQNQLEEVVAGLIHEGKVVGWFQGRQEFGPRALGSRSILGDARNPEMQLKLNLKIKERESFRPFAPSVLAEDAADYFEMESDSPYMLLVHSVRKDRRKELPAGYHTRPLKEKLYHLRSDIPAVTHIDYSARVQTVHEQTNPRFYALLKAFRELTGYSLVVNTSFNVRGEPVVCSPEDAMRCFLRTEMDYLAMGNYLFDKTAFNHPEILERIREVEFVKD